MLFDHFLASNYFLLGCLFSPDEQCPLLGPARITLLLACMVFIKMSPSGIKSVSVSMFRLHAAVIYSGQSRGHKPKDAPSRHQHPTHRNHLLAFSPSKEISFICRHLQAYLQEPTVPRNQNNLKAARSSSKSQNRQVIWNSLQSCSAAHKLQNSTTRKVRILYIFCRMVRVRRAFCAAAVVVFYCVGQSPGRVSSAWEDV